jgi:hypothetical protein
MSTGCDGHRGGDHVAVGLLTAIPTIIAGLVDLLGIPADSPARRWVGGTQR